MLVVSVDRFLRCYITRVVIPLQVPFSDVYWYMCICNDEILGNLLQTTQDGENVWEFRWNKIAICL